MKAGENAEANSSFAFAYQMRCCSDWIWVNLLGKSGDLAHAKYLQVQREFSKLATGRISDQDKLKIEAMIQII